MIRCLMRMSLSGKMMANMLRMTEPGQFTLFNFQAGKKESPDENKALEEEFHSFMAKGITSMRREGENC